MAEPLALLRARRAYERGRAMYAATVAAPLAALAVVAYCLGTRASLACVVGVGLVALSWFFLWRGQSLGRAVLPGIVAGLIPLACAFGARSYGHLCAGGQCISLCIPACALGGGLAGFLVARMGARSPSSRAPFLFGASTLVLLVGSLGCCCVGYGGMLGLLAGVMASIAPTVVLMRPAGAG